MKVHFIFDDSVSQKTIDIIESYGTTWMLMDGLNMLEIEISTIEGLYVLLNKASEVEGKRVCIVIDRLEDDRSKESEPMMYARLTTKSTPFTC